MDSRYITDGDSIPFDDLIAGDTVYVDKTKFACELAKGHSSYLLTRPRRMGKSTMVSTLEYLFSKGTVGTEGLYCHDHWPLTERYFVFRFDWSTFVVSSEEQFQQKFGQDLDLYASYFGVEIPTNIRVAIRFEILIKLCLEKLTDEAFLSQHPELKDGDLPLSSNKVVLLIDEYDAPLTRSIDKPELFDKIRLEIIEFFSSIKNLSYFRNVFITGVSSYVQSSIFGAPNQFIDISLEPRYATCCGYTQEELEQYFAPELDRAKQVLELKYDELLTKLNYYYGGYQFNSINDGHNDSQRLFNPVSVSSFLTSPINGFLNHWTQTGGGSEFLLKQIFLSSEEINRQILRKSYKSVFDSLDLSDPKVNEFIEAWSPFFLFELLSNDQPQDKDRLLCKDPDSLKVDLSEDELFTTDNAIAILYQAGYSAIKRVDDDKVYLGLANYDATKSLVSSIDDERN